eukprot:TRINITY_DN63509_c0_g1_i1.p1 TRINITY_DN63509_c0_g1~~TRINITY_DN63509_c0_g1_i1.p1  ORF type:complete len:510 (+),score=91.75 TRINITY_DN63509_c0_g1_i1:72-1601(+)
MSSKVGADEGGTTSQPGQDGKTNQPVLAWEPVVFNQSPQPDSDKVHNGPSNKGLFSFSDPEEIKSKVRMSLLKAEPYSVFMYYKEEGIWQQIARHPVFENMTLAVIATNAVYIAVDTDWNKSVPLTSMGTWALLESPVFFQFMEHAFCTYFVFEWIVRFMAFKKKCYGLKDAWFVFDSLLVLMMVLETWILIIVMLAMGSGGDSPLSSASFLRLLRLLRLSRLIRMLKSLPELMILIKGMVTAMKSVVYVMGLLVIVTYVFAIAFTQLAVGTPTVGADYFANVAHSMYTLWIYATLLDDLSAFTDSLLEEMWPLLVLSFIFIALAALTVMNMLIGVLCEVVSAVAEKEREEILTYTVSEKMHDILGSLDRNCNSKISYKEFSKIMEMPDALRAFEEVGVNPLGIVDFAELFFFEDGQPIELTFDKFMEMVLDLRESNTATVKDVLNLWMQIKTSTNVQVQRITKQVGELTTRVDEKITRMESAGERIETQLAAVLSEVYKASDQGAADA